MTMMYSQQHEYKKKRELNSKEAAPLVVSSRSLWWLDEYPDCKVDVWLSRCNIGDGMCDGGEYNTEECGWDDGDCIEFNSKYPNCKVDDPFRIGNGYCDGREYDTEECGFDEGDCIEFNQKYPNCKVDYPEDIGDGGCNGDQYNTIECGFDGGDCLEYNSAKYPNCNVLDPWSFGDGFCSKEYDTKECGYDRGDCINERYPNCKVEKPERIADGDCHGREYNTEECGYDGGDCEEFNAKYPNCKVDYPVYLGNGVCSGGEYNTEECGFDGGDCRAELIRVIISIIVGIVGFFSIIVLLQKCVKKRNSSNQSPSPSAPAEREVSIDRNNIELVMPRDRQNIELVRARLASGQSPSTSVPTDNEVSTDRHALVLTSIIHKKVVLLAKDQEVILPNGDRDSNFCKISKKSGSQLDKIDEEAPQKDESNKRKKDITIHMSKFLQYYGQSVLYLMEETTSFHQKVCPICSEEYQPGDDIAWSKNEDCVHAFHTDCIVPWLMDHDDCPMCRNDYIFVDNKDDTSC